LAAPGGKKQVALGLKNNTRSPKRRTGEPSGGAQQRAAAGDPPPAFHTRLKRLLDADRDPESPPELGKGEDSYAFASAEIEGTGTDAAFTAYDAFSLALALELLGAGFKPSEIISLLRSSRRPLERRFNAILKTPPPPRPRADPRDWPGLPTYQEGGKEFADGRVFMVLPTVEPDEVLPLYHPRASRKPKAFPEPKFCRGINELTTELNQMRSPNWSYRKAFVTEIAYLASGISDLLPGLVAPGWTASRQPLPIQHLEPAYRDKLERSEMRDSLALVQELSTKKQGTIRRHFPPEANSTLGSNLGGGWRVQTAWCDISTRAPASTASSSAAEPAT
jgi:hypothetical protein